MQTMKHLLWALITLALIAMPALAQDDLGAFGGIFGGDVGLGAPPVRANAAPARGAAPANRGATPAPDRLVSLRDALSKANTPLTREQETTLNGMLNAEVPAMQRALQAKALELGVRPATPPGLPPGGAVPPRGAPPAGATPPAGAAPQRGPAPAALDPKAEAVLRRFILGLNDQLLMKVASAPTLAAEQQTVVKQLFKEQVRSRGGLDAIKLALEDAGAPFTPDQLTKVQPLFDDQDLARTQLQRESGGQPDPAKVNQLDRDTLTKVLALLSPSQRSALLAATRAAAQQ